MKRLKLFLAVLAVTLASTCSVLASPASARHWTCSHQTSWWYHDGFWHQFAYSYGDVWGHEHVYLTVRNGTNNYWYYTVTCNYA